MNETLGKRIAQYRKEQSLTQENLAERLGISSQAVSKWETDQTCPDILLLPQLSNLLGVSVDTLLSGEAVPAVQVQPQATRKKPEDMSSGVPNSTYQTTNRAFRITQDE